MMKNFKVFSVLLFSLILLASCTTNEVDFNDVPSGTTITNQYSSEGFIFSSPNGPPFALADLSGGGSPTDVENNTLCPAIVVGTNPQIDIDITPSVCNVWLTIIGSSTNNPSVITAFDISNNPLQLIQVSNNNHSTRINHCGIKRVSIQGSNYCIDDLKTRDR